MNFESTLALEQDMAKTLNVPPNEVERQLIGYLVALPPPTAHGSLSQPKLGAKPYPG
jgi:hypothetical protein